MLISLNTTSKLSTQYPPPTFKRSFDLLPFELRQHENAISPEYIAGTNAVGYSAVASMVFLIYDIMLTMDDEVTFIWPIPWSFTKLVYFFLRLFGGVADSVRSVLRTTLFLGTPPFTFTASECYIWAVYQALASTLLIASVDYILVMRVFALYPRGKFVRYGVALLYVAELVTVTIGFGFGVPQLVYDEYCTTIDAPNTFTIASATPIAVQALLFFLTAYKFAQAVRNGWGDVPLLRLLMRDGTWAFFLIFLVLVGEGILFGFAPEAYTAVLYGWMNTVFAFCGYRILLNLNSAGSGRGRSSTMVTNNPTTGPDIQFTSHIYTGQDDESYPMAAITVSDDNVRNATSVQTSSGDA
ncbi:hypothetical protein FA15DRAFT_51579 [Coprinopsis marcescibilis]|uniref:DUF6533 domain-containing protein n=1 Tax=Coprinopsis marcescibilis TaxID=230819 RepID=A0A5C3KQJ4_COPMA|nr:hypothetical protein FA15DRAFT_51579 [Coprinopsis marcescibilis]